MNCFGNIDSQRSKGGLMFSEKNHNFPYVSSWIYSITKCGITVAKKCKHILWIFIMLYLKVSQVKCYNFHIYLTPPPPPHTHTYFRLPTCFLCYSGCPWDIWMVGLASYKNSHGTLFRWLIWCPNRTKKVILIYTFTLHNRKITVVII